MNLWWENNGNDMDSHMYFYDRSGSEIGHLYYSDKQGLWLFLGQR